MSPQPRDEAQEELIETWNTWLNEFDYLYAMVFEPRNMKFGEALMCYEINRMFNKFNEVLDAINSVDTSKTEPPQMDDDDYPWLPQ